MPNIDDGEQEPPDEDYCVVCGELAHTHTHALHGYEPCRPGIDGEQMVKRLRVIAEYQLETEGWYTQAKEVNDAADAIEALLGERKVIIERNSYWRKRASEINWIALAPEKARQRIAELEGFEAWQEDQKAKLRARIAELEGALKKVGSALIDIDVDILKDGVDDAFTIVSAVIDEDLDWSKIP